MRGAMSLSDKKIEELIGIDELCKILKFKKSYIYLMTHERKIPHYKIKGHLRFRLSDIEKWLDECFRVNVKNNNIDF